MSAFKSSVYYVVHCAGVNFDGSFLQIKRMFVNNIALLTDEH